MAKAVVTAGICGFSATVEARMQGDNCKIKITSDCEAIKNLAANLTSVDPYQEISFSGDGPKTLQMAKEYCRHTACPVPVGILKAIEVEARLALPADVDVKLTKDDTVTDPMKSLDLISCIYTI